MTRQEPERVNPGLAWEPQSTRAMRYEVLQQETRASGRHSVASSQNQHFRKHKGEIGTGTMVIYFKALDQALLQLPDFSAMWPHKLILLLRSPWIRFSIACKSLSFSELWFLIGYRDVNIMHLVRCLWWSDNICQVCGTCWAFGNHLILFPFLFLFPAYKLLGTGESDQCSIDSGSFQRRVWCRIKPEVITGHNPQCLSADLILPECLFQGAFVVSQLRVFLVEWHWQFFKASGKTSG